MPSDENRIALAVDGLPAGRGAAATGAATRLTISEAMLNRTVARMRACDITGLSSSTNRGTGVGRGDRGPGAVLLGTAPLHSGRHTIDPCVRQVIVCPVLMEA